jgi:hypothetical protein
MYQTEFAEKNERTQFVLSNFFAKNCAMYEIM